jgi:hypothetical protein
MGDDDSENRDRHFWILDLALFRKFIFLENDLFQPLMTVLGTYDRILQKVLSDFQDLNLGKFLFLEILSFLKSNHIFGYPFQDKSLWF